MEAGCRWAPVKTNFQALLVQESRSPHTQRTLIPCSLCKKSSSCRMTGFGQRPGQHPPLFEGKLRSAFSAFSPVECLVIYVLPSLQGTEATEASQCKFSYSSRPLFRPSTPVGCHVSEPLSPQSPLPSLQFPVSIGSILMISTPLLPSSDTHICLEIS